MGFGVFLGLFRFVTHSEGADEALVKEADGATNSILSFDGRVASCEGHAPCSPRGMLVPRPAFSTTSFPNEIVGIKTFVQCFLII